MTTPPCSSNRSARGRRVAPRAVFVAIVGLASFAACGGSSVSIGPNPDPTSACSCPSTDNPVCGDDGITYSNGCNATCAGAAIVSVGDCRADGGACDCGQAHDPVCAINGITYENACSASCAHQSIAHAGACVAKTPDAGAPDADGRPRQGVCSSGSCGPNELCVDDPCSVPTCYQATGSTCPAGYVFTARSACSAGPATDTCTRDCPSSTHRCVAEPSSCLPLACSCLTSDPCASVGGSCGSVHQGVAQCVFGASRPPNEAGSPLD